MRQSKASKPLMQQGWRCYLDKISVFKSGRENNNVREVTVRRRQKINELEGGTGNIQISGRGLITGSVDVGCIPHGENSSGEFTVNLLPSAIVGGLAV